MKKRLFIIPVVIVSFLLSCFTFTAYADDEPGYDEAFQKLVESDEWQNGTYLFFRLPNREITSNYELYFFSCNDMGSECSYSSGLYSMTSTTEAKGIHLGYVNSSSFIQAENWDASSLTYNESTHELKLPGFRYNNIFGIFEDLICTDVEILGAVVNGKYILGNDPDGLNVSVEFSPDFSGVVDRATYLDNGNVSYLDFFNFTVTNNGNTGIQYVMAIVEKGSSLNFDTSVFSDKGADRIIYDSNVIYVYISQEEVYVNKGAGTFTTATMNSSFHYISPKGQAWRNLVKWDMVDFKENHEYDAVVYAVENEADKTSYVDSSSTTYKFYVADYVDYSNVSEVYRSTFTVKNPAKYDSSSSYHGAVANNNFSDYDDLTKTMFAYTEYTDDGEEKLYGNFKYGEDIHNTSGDLTWVDYGDYSKGSTSYTSLVSEGSGVLRFFSSILSYFPSVFLKTFVIGFWSLIVIAIIKKVT